VCDSCHLSAYYYSIASVINVDSGTSSAKVKEDDPHTVREVPSSQPEMADDDSMYLWDAVDDISDGMISQLCSLDAQIQGGDSEALEADDNFLAASDGQSGGHFTRRNGRNHQGMRVAIYLIFFSFIVIFVIVKR
jgi:hypothetical protein